MRYVDGSLTEPDWLTELKDFARVNFPDHDALLTRHLQSAREWFEAQTLILTASRTVTLYLDAFPPGVIEVRRLPVASITQVDYTDSNGTTQTVATSVYQTSLGDDRNPCRISPKLGQYWPSTLGEMDDVRVVFVAGWSTIGDMPSRYLDAILSRAMDLYQDQVNPSPRTMALVESAKWGGVFRG